MKQQHIESEISLETQNLLSELCGGLEPFRANDDFGDTAWLDEFIEDFIGG